MCKNCKEIINENFKIIFIFVENKWRLWRIKKIKNKFDKLKKRVKL